MRAVQVSRSGGPLETVERPIPEPGPGSVRIRVEACGICHSDALVKEGTFPGIEYPRVPGHEVAGVIDAVGPGVVGWQAGERVGVGWNGGYCGRCDPCRRGDLFACVTGRITGITYDGGYAEYMIAHASAVARMPAGLPPVEAAPLMCAGLTTFNALRNSGARPGDVVAVLGLGGLGHLALQYAARMGFHTVGIARGRDKEPLARQLGASVYIDSQAQDPAAELTALGGARVILATVTSGEAMTAAQGGLAVHGTLLVVGAPASLQVSPFLLIAGRRSVTGWYSGTSIDTQDTLAFSARSGVRSMNEVFPLDGAAEAYDRMMSGQARFRVVLTIGTRTRSLPPVP
jgi:D-arabinose 1-dehydrogenase-like Zn-dependent alcohol dehydrogenase